MHTHDFDPLSGWCSRCNYRDDGRLIGPGGAEWRPGPEYTPAELADLREKARTR